MNRIHTESLFVPRQDSGADLKDGKPSAITSVLVATYVAFACLLVGVMLSVYFLFADQKSKLLVLQEWLWKCCKFLRIEPTAMVESFVRIDRDR